MASRVTADDIKNINRIYFKCKTYAETARQTGFSASTVAKYVDKNWKPIDETRRKIFDPNDLPEVFDNSQFEGLDDFGALCILSEDEKEEIKELWNELEV